MRIKMLAAPIAALALGTTLVSGAVTSADAQRSDDGARKIKECKGRQLAVRLGKTGVAAGSTYQAIRIRNRGRRCAIKSWPEVGYAGRHGGPVGFLAKHNRKWPHRVVLRHGETGRLLLQTPNPGNFPRGKCRPARARRIVTYAPGNIRSNTRHVNKVKHATKVCTTRRGRPHLLYRMG